MSLAPLTPLMREALAKAASPDGLGSWDYASGVLGGLKKRALVARVRVDGRYIATPSGLAELARISQ